MCGGGCKADNCHSTTEMGPEKTTLPRNWSPSNQVCVGVPTLGLEAHGAMAKTIFSNVVEASLCYNERTLEPPVNFTQRTKGMKMNSVEW